MNWLSSSLLGIWLTVTLYATVSTGESSCRLPRSIVNGRAWLTFGGNRVNYDCRPGYLLTGYPYARCERGEWTRPQPACLGKSCPSLGYLDNGWLAYQYRRGQVTFHCDAGFVLTGQSVLKCMGTKWNGTPPTCSGSGPKAAIQGARSEVKYPSKKPLWQSDSGEYSLKSHSDWLSRADYSCIDGATTTLPPPADHASTFSTWQKLDGKARLYTLYRCHWGFSPKGDNDKLYCINRQWSGPHPPMQCLPVEQNTERAQSDQAKLNPITHQDWLRVADYSCLTRTSSIAIPDVIHGSSRLRHVRLDGMPHLYVQYTCEDGYKIVGKPYLYCQRRSWVGATPTCLTSGGSIPNWSRPAAPRNDVTSLCAPSNGGCQHVCEVQYGAKKCRCWAGFQLSTNGHSCYRVVRSSPGRPDSRWRRPLTLYDGR